MYSLCGYCSSTNTELGCDQVGVAETLSEARAKARAMLQERPECGSPITRVQAFNVKGECVLDLMSAPRLMAKG